MLGDNPGLPDLFFQFCWNHGCCNIGIYIQVSAVPCLVPQSCATLCNLLDCSPPGSSVHGDCPGKNTGVGCHALLQEIVPTQGLNPGLPQCRPILYHLSHQGSQWMAGCYFQGKYYLPYYINVNFFNMPPRSSLICKTAGENQREDRFCWSESKNKKL